jgi:hypothetical protein
MDCLIVQITAIVAVKQLNKREKLKLKNQMDLFAKGFQF